jgi:hypothetical protein
VTTSKYSWDLPIVADARANDTVKRKIAKTARVK